MRRQVPRIRNHDSRILQRNNYRIEIIANRRAAGTCTDRNIGGTGETRDAGPLSEFQCSADDGLFPALLGIVFGIVFTHRCIPP